jgi:hypothetical protein
MSTNGHTPQKPAPELARQAAIEHGQLVYGGFFQ